MCQPVFRLFLIFTSLLLLAGCINRSSANLTPDANLSEAKTFYVVSLAADGRGINRLINDRLIQLGYRSSSGPNDAIPDGTDVVVTYADKWMWDITMYMLELTITFRDPESRFPMAVGNSYHTSLTRLSPEEMINEVLASIFNEVKS